MKRFICCVLTILVFWGSAGAAEVPALSAKSVVLMDADSGRVLYGKNEHEPRLIASITKLMTALVALESGHALDEMVTIREEWTGIEGSSFYLKPNEQVRLETLLYGLLLRSGNDAAHAVAGYCAEDVSAFVQRMNEKAAELGMRHTKFANPSGLNAEEHYSSAYDMALLARECLKNEALRKIVSTKTVTVENRVITNHNKLLWQYEGCIGLKTGYTEKAGRTLVSAAQRDGMTLICVTLSAPDDWRDHASLFDYGFETYRRKELVRAGDLLCTIPVTGSLIPCCKIKAQEDFFVALAADESLKKTVEAQIPVVSAPAMAGETVGEVIFTVDGQVVARLQMKLTEAIPEDTAPKPSGIRRLLGR